MPIRRRSKGPGGGQFASDERCEQSESDVPLVVPRPRPTRQACDEAQEDADRAFIELSRVLGEADESGTPSRATNPEIVAARVAYFRATEHQLRLQDARSGELSNRPIQASAEDIPVAFCRTCGSIAATDKQSTDRQSTDAVCGFVDTCPICVRD